MNIYSFIQPQFKHNAMFGKHHELFSTKYWSVELVYKVIASFTGVSVSEDVMHW